MGNYHSLAEYVRRMNWYDRQSVYEAVKQDGLSLKYASEDFQNDKEIVLLSVEQNSLALEYASEKLRCDKELVLVCVKQNGFSLEYASEVLKNDKEVVVEAVKSDGDSILYASEKLKNDKEVVLEAVKQNGYYLLHTSEELKNDKEVVFEAVKQNGHYILYANEELKNDIVFVMKCCLIDRRAIQHIGSVDSHLAEKMKIYGTDVERAFEEFERERWREQSLQSKQEKEHNNNGTLLFKIRPRRRETYRTCIKTQNKCFKDLEVFRVLGRGAFGSTYLCKIDGCFGLFVIKLYQNRFFGFLSVEKEKKYLERDNLQIPSHENVVPILYHSDSEIIDLSKLPDFEEFWKKEINGDEHIQRGGMLIMKYHQTTLSSVVEIRTLLSLSDVRFGDIFLPSEVISVMKGIISGAFHLHQNMIVHRDLHLGNIFIHLEMGRVWIGDYGCCLDLRKNATGFRVHKDEEILYSFSGSFRYLNKTGGESSHCSPEIREFDPSKSVFLDYSKSDLYSCGFIGRQLIDLSILPVLRRRGHSSFAQLIESMIIVDFEKRITFNVAVERIESFVESFEIKEQKQKIQDILENYNYVRILAYGNIKLAQKVRDRRACPYCLKRGIIRISMFRLEKGGRQFMSGCQHGKCGECGGFFCFNCLKDDCPNSYLPCKNSKAETQRILYYK